MWLPAGSRIGGQFAGSVLEFPGCGVIGVVSRDTGAVCRVHVGQDETRTPGQGREGDRRGGDGREGREGREDDGREGREDVMGWEGLSL